MKTAKQEAIEKAYGEHWEKLKKYVDSDGCIPYEYLEDDEYLFNFYDNIETEYNGDSWRPISLKGLETNNGWIRIESEEDLPKEEGRYYTISNQNDEIVTMKFPVEKFDLEFNRQWWLKYITHYQKVTLPERPIY